MATRQSAGTLCCHGERWWAQRQLKFGPCNISWCAITEPEPGRYWQHWPSCGSILEHYGIFFKKIISKSNQDAFRDMPDKPSELRIIGLLWVESYGDSGFILYILTEAEWRIYASVTYANTGSDNGLLPVRHQAIIWTNAGMLSIRPSRINFREILFKIRRFSFKKIHFETASILSRPQCVKGRDSVSLSSMVSLQKGPTRHAYAWQIGPFWQDTLVMTSSCSYLPQIYAGADDDGDVIGCGTVYVSDATTSSYDDVDEWLELMEQ